MRPSLSDACARLRRRLGHREDGTISILILGLFLLTTLLIMGAIDVTAAQLARMRLLDAADSAALDASDALDEESAYTGGIGKTVVLTDSSVQAAATDHLGRTPRPAGISQWAIGSPTGSSDGQTATVTVTGRATLPVSSWVLERFGGGVTITVTSTARAPLVG